MSASKNPPLFKIIVALSLSSLFIVALLLKPVYSQNSPQPIILTDTQTEYLLGLHLEILKDAAGQLTIEQVASSEYESEFRASQEEVPNFGYTDAAIWLRFQVKNETTQTDEWRLEYGFANIQNIRFYLPQPEDQSFQVKQTGVLYPFNTRDIAYHRPVFKLPLAPGDEQTVYLRLQSEASLQAPLTLWHPETFAAHSRNELLLAGLFLGILLIMAGYNLFVWFFLRDTSYVYYVLFVIGITMFYLSFSGLAGQYLWPTQPWLYRYAVLFSSSWTVVFSLAFATSFLNTKVQSPTQHKILLVLTALWGLVFIQLFLMRYSLVAQQTNFLALASYIWLIWVGFSVWGKGYRSARYYLLAWSLFFATVIVLILTQSGLLPSTILTRNSYELGSVWLVLFLSLALADRINLLKQETEQANHNLAESERRLNQFLEAIPIGVVVHDTKTRPQYINERAMEIFNITNPNVKQNPTSARTMDETQQEYPLYIAHTDQPYPREKLPLMQALQGETATADDIELIRPNHRVLIESWSTPLFDQQGQVQSVISIFQDITERKQIEAELEQYRNKLEEQVTHRTAALTTANEKLSQEITERRLTEKALAETLALIERAKREWEASVDSLPQLICLLDRQGLLLRTNKTIEDWGLASVRDVKGLTLPNILTLNGSTSSTFEDLWLTTWASLQTGQASEYEFRHASLERYLYLQAQPIAIQDMSETREDSFAVVIIQDVTERKLAETALRESEARLRHIFSSINAHIYVTELTEDGQRLNRYMSPTQALTGYLVDKFLNDLSFWPTTLVHPDDKEMVISQSEKFNNSQNVEMEYRLIRADGETIWVRDNGRVDKSLSNDSIIIYGVVSDITERKLFEEALAEARDQALAASGLKTRLLAKVSHELRTPLNAILGFAELLANDFYGPVSEKQKLVITDIIDSANYLNAMVNELLDQAQLEAGRLQLKQADFSPTKLLAQVEAPSQIAAQNKGLKLLIHIDASVPAILTSDPDRVQQILTNLINNAVKFTTQGQVEVKVYCFDDKWVIQVSDTGPGIAPDAQVTIFDPFWQVDDTSTRVHRGYGLGLSIVKELTELMGGEITVDSKVGQGSTFTVQLPLKIK